MNRTCRMLVAAVLALVLSLSFGTAFAKNGNANPGKPHSHKPTQTAIDSITLTLTDRSGNAISPDVISGEYTVVTKHRYLAAAAIAPSNAKRELKWKSSKPSVVSVNGKGALYCNKPGKAVITVSCKKSAVKQSIVVNVRANEAVFNTAENRTVKRVYLSGSRLMMDVVLVNSTEETMTAAPDLAFFLKLSGESDFTALGVKSGHLRRAIAAHETGTAVYRIKKVDPKTISLLNASANCQLP